MSDTNLNGHPKCENTSPQFRCRKCRLVYLLERLPDVTDRGTHTGQGDGTNTPKMSAEYGHRSYIELRRILFLMLAQPHLKDRRHMLAYFEAEHRLHDELRKVTGPNRGKKTTIIVRTSERIVPSWVNIDRVHSGLQFVGDNFHGDPSLPDAFLTDRRYQAKEMVA
jgi:hypothetical protein